MSNLFIQWSPSPIFFTIGPIEIRYYGLFFALGFVVAYYVMRHIFNQEHKPIDLLDKLTMYIFFGVLIGARLGHCLFYQPDYYFSKPLEIILPFDTDTWQFIGYQGLASHGGAIGILVALYLFCRNTRTPFVWIVDRLVIVIGLVGALIRMGNLMNSEIYGQVTSLPIGFIFERNGETLAKHPTQIYESLSYILISVALFLYYKKHKGTPRNGVMFGMFLIALFSVRFLIEFVKENQVDFEQSMTLNMGQWLSVPFIVGGVVILYLAQKGKFASKK